MDSAISKRVCKGCREAQLEKRESPRFLRLLPTLTAGFNDQKRKYQVLACEFCDGPVVENAHAHAEKLKRLQGQ